MVGINLAVRYGIAICIILYESKKILADFDLVVAKLNRQTTKFNFPPIFPAMQYRK